MVEPKVTGPVMLSLIRTFQPAVHNSRIGFAARTRRQVK